MSGWSKSNLSIFTGPGTTVAQRSGPKPAPATLDKDKALADDATVMAVAPEIVEVMAKEAAVAERWEVGDVILDLYEVEGALGEGGMGQVYRVRHMGWNVDLAVKTPRPEIFSQEGVKESFVSEAETWVNLGLHPHVVSCYYVRTLGGIPRVFVEYVEGGSLSDWIRERRLYAGGEAAALERILDISIQFAWGLRFAHQQGLVHQDVKPANVMMTPEGAAKVTDFGLARAIGAVETAGGNSHGPENPLVSVRGMTPAYCSPEQAGGRIVSLKTDIWSWAVSVLEMFTGEVTWMAGQVAGLALEDYLENCDGDASIPPMPAPLAELLRRSLRMEPSERPAHMKEVAETLQAIYKEVIGRDYERPQPRAGQGTADSLNNRALSLLDLGKVKEAEAAWEAALAADLKHPETTFNYGVLRWRRGELTDIALVQQLESVRALHPADWRIDYFFSLFHLERGDIRASLWFLEAASRKSPESIELQKLLELARSGKISGNTPVHDLATRPGVLDECMFSSDGGRMLTIGAGGVMGVWETESGSCLRTEENPGPVTFASLSGDGRLAFTGDGSHANLWDSSTGQVLRVSRFEDDAALARRLTQPDPESRKGYLLRVLKTQLLFRVALPLFLLMLASGLFGFLASLLIVFVFILAVSSYQKDKEEHRARFMSRRAHVTFIERACLSSDGKHVLTWNTHRGMNFETLRYWDTLTGECLYTLEENTGDMTTFGPMRGTGVMDQRAGWVLRFLFAQGTFKTTLSFWKWARPKTAAETASALDMESLRLPGGGQSGRVVAQFLSDDGRYALTGSDDNTVRLYNLEEKRWRRTFRGHYGAVTAVCLSEDGRSVLSGSDDATVRLWDVASGRCLKTFHGHEDRVTSVCISRDARYALSGSTDRTVRLWDVKTGCCVRVFAGHRDQVLSARLSCGGNFALSAGTNASLLRWDIPKPNGELFPAQMSRVRSTAEVIEREGQVRDLLERGEAAMQDAVFDDALALIGRARQTPGFERMRQNLEEWEKLSLYCQRVGVRTTWPARILEQHTGIMSAVCLSGDGRYAFSGSHLGKFGAGSGTLRLWDVYEGRSLKEFKYGETVYCVGLSANGDWGVSGGANGEINLWDFRKGRYQHSFSGHTRAVTSVAISGDGRYVLSCGEDRTLRLWDADSGNYLRTTGGILEVLYSVSLSPTGRYAISGEGNGLVRLWELASGRCVLTLKGHSPTANGDGCCVHSVCISNDERFALSGGADRTMRLWKLETGECVRVFSGHTGPVTSACFSSDGGYALSGGADKTLRLWEVETGQCLHVLEGHTGPVTSVALSPNARYALSSGGDGTLRLWEIDWELKAREPAAWDEGARPLLEAFLLAHTPPQAEMPVHRPARPGEIKRALTRSGTPVWSEQDFQSLIRQLQYAGYGWLRPEGVESKLKEMADDWRQVPALVKKKPRPLSNLPHYLSSRRHHYGRALKPYAMFFAFCGVVALIALLYNVCSRMDYSDYRRPPGDYMTYDGPGVYPRQQTYPRPLLDGPWSTYTPGGHGLSVELPRWPTVMPEVSASKLQVASAEGYQADVPEYGLSIRILRLVSATKITDTLKKMLSDYVQSVHTEYGGDSSGDQFTPREEGGMTVTGTAGKDGRRWFFKALVLKRGREAWLITMFQEDSYVVNEAERATERVINSVRF